MPLVLVPPRPPPKRPPPGGKHWGHVAEKVTQKGTNGVITNGVTADFMFLTEGLFGYSHQPAFIFPKVPGRTFFPNLSKCINHFCSGPISVDPIRPQPSRFRVYPKRFPARSSAHAVKKQARSLKQTKEPRNNTTKNTIN